VFVVPSPVGVDTLHGPPLRLMRHRPFALFWWARVSATVAYQMLAVAIGWQIYELTGSALDLGLIGLMQFLPLIAMGLFIGHIADRYDRRVIVRICFLVEALAAAMLAAGSLADWLTRDAMLAIVLLVGSARAFELPTMQALMPQLVPAQMIARGAAASSSANQTAIIGGPALGGLLYLAGPAVVYVTCAVILLAAAVLVIFIRLELAPIDRRPFTFASLFAGLAFVRSRPMLLGIITLDFFAVFLGGATALLPIFARDILGTGPWGLGLLRSAPALGALAAAIYLANHPLERRVGRIMFMTVALFGCATVVFALSTSFALSFAALVVLGAADSISVVIRLSLVQIETPDAMRGRVTAVNAVSTGTTNTLGDFRAGLFAALFGVVPAVLIGGIGTVLVALIWMRLFPQLVRLEALEQPRTVTRPQANAPA
jgi:MFS family permease